MQPIIDELTYIIYAYNRDRSPEISPERWAKIFEDGAELEARYQDERLHPVLKGRKKFPPAHFGQRSRYAAEPESDMERDRR